MFSHKTESSCPLWHTQQTLTEVAEILSGLVDPWTTDFTVRLQILAKPSRRSHLHPQQHLLSQALVLVSHNWGVQSPRLGFLVKKCAALSISLKFVYSTSSNPKLRRGCQDRQFNLDRLPKYTRSWGRPGGYPGPAAGTCGTLGHWWKRTAGRAGTGCQVWLMEWSQCHRLLGCH